MDEIDEILSNTELKVGKCSKIERDMSIIYHYIISKYVGLNHSNKNIISIGKEIRHCLSLYNDKYLNGYLDMTKIKVVKCTSTDNEYTFTKEVYGYSHGVIIDGIFYYWYRFIRYLEEKYYYISVLNKIDKINDNN